MIFKKLFLLFMLFSTVQNCMAMGQNILNQETKFELASIGRKCLYDVSKLTIGATAFMSSLWVVAVIPSCDRHQGQRIPFGTVICSMPVQLNAMSCIGASGLYTLIQSAKLVQHSWEFVKAITAKGAQSNRIKVAS